VFLRPVLNVNRSFRIRIDISISVSVLWGVDKYNNALEGRFPEGREALEGCEQVEGFVFITRGLFTGAGFIILG
jgi:hypothetical protein